MNKNEGFNEFTVKWVFKTPGNEINKTLFDATLQLKDEQQNRQSKLSKKSLFNLLQYEIDFWINEILVKKILKQRVKNANEILEPSHNLEPDQFITLKDPDQIGNNVKKHKKNRLGSCCSFVLSILSYMNIFKFIFLQIKLI